MQRLIESEGEKVGGEMESEERAIDIELALSDLDVGEPDVEGDCLESLVDLELGDEHCLLL